MKPADVLKIVKETFSEELSSSASMTVLGLESRIEGESQFMESLEKKLNLLFDENDLSKF